MAQTKEVIIGDHGLALFQNHNCTGCYYADKKMVGTGTPCCQFGFRLNITSEGNKCMTRLENGKQL